MGIVYMHATVNGPEGSDTLEFLVDTGAGYTLLPMKTWKKLGLKSDRTERFRLADGSPIDRRMSECQITIDGRTGHTPVLLGEADDEALLGVITLEEFGLVVNPFTRQLQPMRMMLA
jgi:clan AA aspartic protease